jgi:hypothetical protein
MPDEDYPQLSRYVMKQTADTGLNSMLCNCANGYWNSSDSAHQILPLRNEFQQKTHTDWWKIYP